MKQFNLEEYLKNPSRKVVTRNESNGGIAMEDEYKRFGIKVNKIDQGLSFGVCISYDKYMKECYLFINLIKWEVSIGWLTFERKKEEEE